MSIDQLTPPENLFEQRGPNVFEKVLRFSIQHRYLVLLFTVGIGVIGAFSLKSLPIDAVPDITNKQVQINTLAPALGPSEIEMQVTFPVETALAGIAGLDYTRSLSRNGFSQVSAVFEESVDIYWARQQVAERLAAVAEDMPMGANPQMGPLATGLGEVYSFAVEFTEHDSTPSNAGEPGWQPDGSYLTPEGELLRSDLEKAAYLRTIMEWIVVPQLSLVKGIASVDVIGGYEKQYHVQPDPVLLMQHSLTFHDVVDALEQNNVSTGAGFIEHKGNQYIVKADSRVSSIEEIGAIKVGDHAGTPIFIRDIANVLIGEELRTGAASENGHEVVIGTTLMIPGDNSRTVSIAVAEKMDEVRKSLPSGVQARELINRSELVNATIKTVVKNLSEGALLVIVVLFLMLGNFRAACITALAIPLSMLMAGFGMVQAGISGNLMSLGAIDFGIIVDGAVVIVENSIRRLAEAQHRKGGLLSLRERLHEVYYSAREMVKPSVFGQIIIAIVYVPILALTGTEGKMFHPMALTVVFALAGAFILSLTFVPAAVAVFVTGRVKEQENIIVRKSKAIYAPVLEWAIRFRLVVIGGATASFLGAVLLFSQLGTAFIPTLDEGNLAFQSLRMPSTSLSQSMAMQFEVEKAIAALPEVELIFSKTGTTEVAFDPMPPSISDGFIILTPRNTWEDPALTRVELFEKIENATANLPGQIYEGSQPIQLRFNELLSGIRGDLAVKVFGDDYDIMVRTAAEISKVIEQIPGAADVKVEQTEGLPFMNVNVDREAAARYGLSMSDVQEVVAVAVGGREAGLVFEGDRRFPLIVRLPDSIREDISTLEELPIPLPAVEEVEEGHSISLGGGNQSTIPPFVPLRSIASITVEEGPNQVSRENGKRRVTVSANVRGRDLGSFVEDVQRRVASDIVLPPGTWLDYGGAFENLLRARERLSVVVPVCFFLIFLLLFTTFNSVRYALLVFSGVPLGLTGGVLALWLRGIEFSISAAVGFIALSGVAVLNGLVMVSYINQLRAEGVPLDEAIRRGAITRLRPVLMTALVASLGFLPMALSTSAGAEVQRPLATVVIGGLVSATILTLIVLPALYRLWHRKEEDILHREDPEHLATVEPSVD